MIDAQFPPTARRRDPPLAGMTLRLVLYGALLAPPITAVLLWIVLTASGAALGPEGVSTLVQLKTYALLPTLVRGSFVLGSVPGAIVAAVVAVVRLVVGPLRWWGVLVAGYGAAILLCAAIGTRSSVISLNFEDLAIVPLTALPALAALVLLRRRLGLAALVERPAPLAMR